MNKSIRHIPKKTITLKARYHICIAFLFSAAFLNAQQYNADSILTVAGKSITDSARAVEYSRAFSLFLDAGNFKRADSVVQIQKAIAEKSHYDKSDIFYRIDQGQLLQMQGKYPEALDFLLSALKIAEEKKFTKLIGNVCNSIGIIHFTQQEYDKALEFYFKAADISEKNKHQRSLGVYYNNIGNAYYSKKDYPKALEYYQIALDYARQTGQSTKVANFLNNIGSLYIQTNDFSKAMKAFDESQQLLEQTGDKYNLLYCYLNQGSVYLKQKNYGLSLQRLSTGLKMAEEISSPEAIRDANLALSEYYTGKNNAPLALHHYTTYIKYRDTLNNDKFIKQITEKEMTHEFAQKELVMKAESEKKNIQIEEERKRNKLTLLFGLLGLLLVTMVAFSFFNRYKLTQKHKKEIEEKSTEIIDSILYAQRLQNAVLIPEAELSKNFPEIFVLYKPRDMVSGDFYWFSESAQNRIIAVADCTGHGVPGAFMSMLGYESLQNIALKENITTTSEALKNLDLKITETLNKSSRSFRDGMDIALCAFSKTENKLQYSGANRPLLHISEGILTEHSPDKHAIGGDIDNTEKNYSTKEIPYRTGDIFYLFTDGYADQFGGEKGKKFKYRQLKNLLLSCHTQPLPAQKTALENAFRDWKGKLEQVDDICVIGIKM